MPSAPQTPLKQQQSTFHSRPVIDDTAELNPQTSTFSEQGQPSSQDEGEELNEDSIPHTAINKLSIPPRSQSFARNLLHVHEGRNNSTSPSTIRQRSVGGRQKPQDGSDLGESSSAPRVRNGKEQRMTEPSMSTPKLGLGPRPVGGRKKLGTFSGVFVPTSLNVLSILMFLRFGFILGQGGVLGIMGKLRMACGACLPPTL
jgi:potassium/chloride transporter 9